MEEQRAYGDEQPAIPRFLAGLPKIASLLAICAGVLVLVGWHLDIEGLTRVSPGFLAMDPLTAVAFICAGICLAASAEGASSAAWFVAKTLGVIVLVIGCAKVGAFIVASPAAVDHLLYPAKFDSSSTPALMTLHSGVNLALLGISLTLIDARRQPAFFSQLFALLAGCTSLFVLTGYVYGARELFGATSLMPLAIHGAATFLVLAMGIFFARPRSALAHMFVTDDPAGALARRLFPAAVALTLVLGWFAVEGQRRGLYEMAVGTALLALLLVVIFTMLLRWTSGSLERGRSDTQRALLERSFRLEESLRAAEMVLNHTPEMIWTLDANARVLTMNAASDRVIGMQSRGWVGKFFYELHEPEERELIVTALQQAMAGFSTEEFAFRVTRENGRPIVVAWRFLWSAPHQQTVCVGREKA